MSQSRLLNALTNCWLFIQNAKECTSFIKSWRWSQYFKALLLLLRFLVNWEGSFPASLISQWLKIDQKCLIFEILFFIAQILLTYGRKNSSLRSQSCKMRLFEGFVTTVVLVIWCTALLLQRLQREEEQYFRLCKMIQNV